MTVISEEVFALLPIQFQHYICPSQKADWGNSTSKIIIWSEEFWEKNGINCSRSSEKQAEQKFDWFINQWTHTILVQDAEKKDENSHIEHCQKKLLSWLQSTSEVAGVSVQNSLHWAD